MNLCDAVALSCEEAAFWLVSLIITLCVIALIILIDWRTP
jgi:hypothetical protein